MLNPILTRNVGEWIRGVVLCLGPLLTGCLLLAQTPASPPSPDAALRQALERYSAGDYASIDVAAADLAGRRLDFGGLSQGTAAWIAAGDPQTVSRRRLVGSTFALDLVWHATRNPANANADEFDLFAGLRTPDRYPWRKIPLSSWMIEFPIVSWACQFMSKNPPAEPGSRWWWLASVALLEDGHTWQEILGSSETNAKRIPTDSLVGGAEFREGHVAHARAHVSNEPRWALAEVVARTSIEVGRVTDPDRPDVLRDVAPPSPAVSGMLSAEREWQSLEREPSLIGEAELHLGYLDLRMRHWSSAMSHLNQARPHLDEPFLIAMDDYLSGWVEERLGQPDAALGAYLKANTLMPGMRNLSTLIAARLFLNNDIEEAHAVFSAGLQMPPSQFDILTIFDRGDARLFPAYLEKIHEAWR